MKQKIRVADCILALYDVTRHETIDDLERTWLPLIRDVCGTDTIGKAVLVVGAKKDLLDREGEADDDLSLLRLKDEEERLKKVLSNYPFVLACYRCSAKDIDVDQIFYEGELAVSFPIAPLFDVKKAELTEPCQRAFAHIFRIFDTNQDGLLDDKVTTHPSLPTALHDISNLSDIFTLCDQYQPHSLTTLSWCLIYRSYVHCSLSALMWYSKTKKSQVFISITYISTSFDQQVIH